MPLFVLSCMIGREVCDGEYEFCGSWFAVPYFVSFVIVVSFLVLNLFVAVIMDNFEYLTQDDSHLGETDLPRFVDLWRRFDPKATGLIHHRDLALLLREEPPPLGFGKKCPENRVFAKMVRLNIPLSTSGMVQFNASLLALLRVNLGIYSSTSTASVQERNVDMRNKLQNIFQVDAEQLDSLVPPASFTGMTTGIVYAVLLLQRTYRATCSERRAARQEEVTERVPLEAGAGGLLRRPTVLRRTLSSDVRQG